MQNRLADARISGRKGDANWTSHVGDAELECGQEAGWLFASPETNRWVAGYHGLTPAPLTLTVPEGKVEIDAIQVGTVYWDNGKVTVDAVGMKGTPRVAGGQLVEGL